MEDSPSTRLPPISIACENPPSPPRALFIQAGTRSVPSAFCDGALETPRNPDGLPGDTPAGVSPGSESGRVKPRAPAPNPTLAGCDFRLGVGPGYEIPTSIRQVDVGGSDFALNPGIETVTCQQSTSRIRRLDRLVYHDGLPDFGLVRAGPGIALACPRRHLGVVRVSGQSPRSTRCARHESGWRKRGPLPVA